VGVLIAEQRVSKKENRTTNSYSSVNRGLVADWEGAWLSYLEGDASNPWVY
jgi:hypothetical protein